MGNNRKHTKMANRMNVNIVGIINQIYAKHKGIVVDGLLKKTYTQAHTVTRGREEGKRGRTPHPQGISFLKQLSYKAKRLE